MEQIPVELRDQLSIDTPELVQLEFPIAGLGSRSLACLFDYFLQWLAFIGVILLMAWVGPGTIASHSAPVKDTSGLSDVWAFAIVILIAFLFQWGYFTLFEAFWNGQTPGKRLFRLRVIEQSGRSISFMNALSRNLLRIVDGLPGFYMVGIIFLFSTRCCQRLGDMVAGTIVIHERKIATPMWDGNAARTFTASLTETQATAPVVRPTGLPADVIAKLTLEDVEVIESFDARRLDLPVEAGATLAQKLAEQMAAKMNTELPAEMDAVDFLAGVAVERRAIGHQ